MDVNKNVYKITLADGTVIDELAINGNNFISTKEIDPAIFDANCAPVVINNGEIDDVHNNMELVQVTPVDGTYWFVLRDISREELEQEKIKSDIEYLAMMCDVEL